jgi:hypothetical protein
MPFKMEGGRTWEINGSEEKKKKLKPKPAPAGSGFEGGGFEKGKERKLIPFYCSNCKGLVKEVYNDSREIESLLEAASRGALLCEDCKKLREIFENKKR